MTTRRRQDPLGGPGMRWVAALLVILTLPLTQALWVGLGLGHTRAHGADHHAHHAFENGGRDHSDHGHSHDADHPERSHPERSHPEDIALEILLHGHDHGEGTAPHRHHVTRPAGHRPVTATPPVPTAGMASLSAPSPTLRRSPPDDSAPPAERPLRLRHCSWLI